MVNTGSLISGDWNDDAARTAAPQIRRPITKVYVPLPLTTPSPSADPPRHIPRRDAGSAGQPDGDRARAIQQDTAEVAPGELKQPNTMVRFLHWYWGNREEGEKGNPVTRTLIALALVITGVAGSELYQ